MVVLNLPIAVEDVLSIDVDPPIPSTPLSQAVF
jgi:hypothetical protein